MFVFFFVVQVVSRQLVRTHADRDAGDIAVGILTSPREPYRSRAELVRVTWGGAFPFFAGYTAEPTAVEDWRIHIPLTAAEVAESGRRPSGAAS